VIRFADADEAAKLAADTGTRWVTLRGEIATYPF
jgi:hypothetical protein